MQLPESVTRHAKPEQLKEWKAKHGEIHVLEFDDKSAIVRKPTTAELGRALTLGKNNPLEFNKAILHSCWLAGDEEIKTDQEYFLGAGEQMATLVQSKQAELKKITI